MSQTALIKIGDKPIADFTEEQLQIACGYETGRLSMAIELGKPEQALHQLGLLHAALTEWAIRSLETHE